MTRAKISEYSATANDNTDVNGVDIAEGCPPSSMNNMGREIMAALKRFQVGSDGDGVTVGGALVVSGATTANTFSATNVTASGTITTAAGTASAPAIVPTGDTNTGIFFPAADTIAFAEGGAEAMRIDTSGNLLLGTTSHETGAFGSAVGMNINSTRPQMLLRNSATTETAYMGIAGNIFYVATEDAIPLAFVTSDVERARITAGGDLQFNSGYGSVATAYGCRAWVNFNGTGTPAIREDGNVSSITDNGTGDYTVNFTTAMVDANYCIQAMDGRAPDASGGERLAFCYVDQYSTSSCRVLSNKSDATFIDHPSMFVAIFR